MKETNHRKRFALQILNRSKRSPLTKRLPEPVEGMSKPKCQIKHFKVFESGLLIR